jgi:hypothetical protein
VIYHDVTPKEMLPHVLGWFGILRAFELIHFPGSVVGAAEAGDGKLTFEGLEGEQGRLPPSEPLPPS